MKATQLISLFVLIILSLSHSPSDEKIHSFDYLLDLLKEELANFKPTELSHINAHIIPHSHDDVGWHKTVDQYYTGTNKQYNSNAVQYIFDSLIPMLNLDPEKRFIYVEIAFFERWWNEQNDDVKSLVQQLVQTGQFEFINGGWCMNDEAAIYYEDTIDQMWLGHKFLLENFGAIPEVGWHIDPFGHASAQAALFAQMGFNAFYFARVDPQDQISRYKNRAMEMVWVPNTSQGIENAIFTHVLFASYSNPQGFDFDVKGDDDPIQDDPRLEGYNAKDKADLFEGWFRLIRLMYRTPDLMHTAGGDFEYMDAEMNFKNYDKLFNYIRAHPEYNITVSYSTPSEYLRDIYAYNVTYPMNYYDFFPYSDRPNAYWTGFYTSRVALKGIVRQEGRFLQAVRRLLTQAIWEQTWQFAVNNFSQIDTAIDLLEQAMGVAQYHDAVTGTEAQAVTEHYKLQFAIGENAIKQVYLH